MVAYGERGNMYGVSCSIFVYEYYYHFFLNFNSCFKYTRKLLELFYHLHVFFILETWGTNVGTSESSEW